MRCGTNNELGAPLFQHRNGTIEIHLRYGEGEIGRLATVCTSVDMG
jgi:hypothetical protein